MSKINDGGAAFPAGDMREYEPSFGMTLRDYFAAHADLSSMQFKSVTHMAAFMKEPVPEDNDGLISLCARATAKIRYAFADAMLSARSQKEGE